MTIRRSVHFINQYSVKHHNGKIQCTILPGKGRVLIATRPFKCGETIFVEPQLRAILANDKHPIYQKLCKWKSEYDFSLEPIWYWCAINCVITPSVVQEAETLKRNAYNRHHSVLQSRETCENDETEAPNECISLSESQDASDSGENENMRGDDVSEVQETDSEMNDEVSSLCSGDVSGEGNLWLQLDVISEDVKEQLELLHKPENQQISTEVEILINKLDLHGVITRMELENMLQIWVHNCFDFHEDPDGYATYFMSSFFSHSCLPNAIWRLEEDNKFVLSARLDIKTGEEITISYLDENNLVEPAFLRQRLIESTKGFTCTCPRCICPADLSRGFTCPKCKQGVVFLHPDSGTSRDKDLLRASFPSVVAPPNVKMPEYVERLENLIDPNAAMTTPTEIVARLYLYRPFVCYGCQYKLQESDLRKFLKIEKRALRFIRRLNPPSSDVEDNDQEGSDELTSEQGDDLDSELKKEKENIQRENFKSFPSMDDGNDNGNCNQKNVNGFDNEGAIDRSTQEYYKHHWISYRIETHFKEQFVSSGNMIEALRRTARRLLLCQRMLFSVSGCLSWIYDELADLYLLYKWDFKPSDSVSFIFSSDEIQQIVEDLTPWALYSEAFRLQSILFSPNHEYSSEVRRKMQMFKDCVISSCIHHRIPIPSSFTPRTTASISPSTEPLCAVE